MVVNKIIGTLVDKRLINERLSKAQDSICYLCSGVVGSNALICSSCKSSLPVLKNTCPVCALPTTTGSLCANCIQDKKPLIYRTVCPYQYAYPVNKLIHDLKFHSRLEIVDIFARSLADKINTDKINLPGCLIPAPLHGSRVRQRGYNQSSLIAHNLSEKLDLPVINNALFRSRKTVTQSGLTARLRKRNVKDAFAINREVLSAFDHVAIVDDVVTTGATVREMARMINYAGVKHIDVWVCARTVI